jgi:hypothetical protein
LQWTDTASYISYVQLIGILLPELLLLLLLLLLLHPRSGHCFSTVFTSTRPRLHGHCRA